MDLDGLKELLKTDEGKAEVQKLIDDAVTGATGGLRDKNNALINEVKTEREKRREAQSIVDQIKAEKDAVNEAAALKSGDFESIKKAILEKHQTELSALNERLTSKDGQLKSLLIDDGLHTALSKAGVSGAYLDGASALIKSKHKAEVIDDNGRLLASFDGQAVNDFVAEWTGSDTGKHYVTALVNGGGGSNGASGTGGAGGDNKNMTGTQLISAGLSKLN